MRTFAALAVIAALLAAAGAGFAAQAQVTDDFSLLRPEWKPFSGEWKVENGELIQTTSEYDCGIRLNYEMPRKFKLSVKMKALGERTGGGLFFNLTSKDSKARSQMVRLDPTGVIYGHFDDHGDFQPAGTPRMQIKVDTWHELAVVVDNDIGRYSVYFDSRAVAENVALEFTEGSAAIQSSEGPQAFDDFAIEEPSQAELSVLKPGYPFDSGRGIAVDDAGRIYISQGRGDAIVVVNRQGKRIASFGKHGPGRFETIEPSALALDASGTMLYVLDKPAKKVVVFETTGKPVKEAPLSELISPSDIALDSRGNLFVTDAEKCCLAVYDETGKLRTTYGTKGKEHGQLDSPTSVAIDRSDRIYVGDQLWTSGRLEILSFDPRTYKIAYSATYECMWGTKDIVVTSKNRIALLGALGLWESGGVVRLLEPNLRPCGNFSGFSIGAIGQRGAIAVGPGDWIYVLDAAKDRVCIVPPDLSEPRPEVRIKPGRAEISWMTSQRGHAVLRAREEGSNPDSWVSASARSSGRKHSASVISLETAKRYVCQFSPTIETIPPIEWSKDYWFLSSPGPGKTALLNFDVVVVFYLSTELDGKPFDLPIDKLGNKVQTEFEKAKLFYLRNSLFKVNINLKDYLVITDKRVKVESGWIDPEEVRKDIRPRLAAEGKNLDDYDSVFAVYANPGYDADKPDWLGATNGGGLTPFGYSVIGISGTPNWLFVHEYDHQVDAFFNESGFPEYWFDHPDTTIHPGNYGSQFAILAYFWRHWPATDWFWCRFGKVIIADDKDEDGVPDADPRLALDEARLGSDPTVADTDGDGLSDLGEASAGIFTSADPHNPDTDGNGIIDGKDNYPLYPIKLERPKKNVKIDGKIEPGEWTELMQTSGPYINGTTYLNWDNGCVEFAAVMDRPFRLELDIDADGDGWFYWTGRYEVRVSPGEPGQPCKTKGADGVEAVYSEADGKTVLEVRVPVTAPNEKLGKGAPMSFRIGLGVGDNVQHVFEPWIMPVLVRR